MSQTILIIDDEADIRDILSDIFEDEGFNVLRAAHSEQALSIVKETKPDLIVLDIWLENSDMDGIGILKHLKKSEGPYADIPILMISGHGNIEMAVKAMKIGAYDYIEKPFKIDHMLLTVDRALEQHHLRAENSKLKNKNNLAPETYKSKSPAFQSLLKTIHDDRGSEARVVITGEVGTGKTRLANYIHSLSNRCMKPLHTWNSSQLSNDIINKWAHDSAYHYGTILIKHIDKLSSECQEALLKYLSSHLPVEAPRIIATSFEPLGVLSKSGAFSSALADRLSVQKITMPSLRDRKADIPDLVASFIKQIDIKTSETVPMLSSDAIHYLSHLQWPGNIAQLKSFLEFLSFHNLKKINEGKMVEKSDVMVFFDGERKQDINQGQSDADYMFDTNLFMMPLKDAREQFERVYLSKVLADFQGNVSQMALHVDMERTALHRKLKNMDIRFENETKNSADSVKVRTA